MIDSADIDQIVKERVAFELRQARQVSAGGGHPPSNPAGRMTGGTPGTTPIPPNRWQGPFWTCPNPSCRETRCWGTRLLCFRCGVQRNHPAKTTDKPVKPPPAPATNVASGLNRQARVTKPLEVEEEPPTEDTPLADQLRKAQEALAKLRDIGVTGPHITEAIAQQEVEVQGLQEKLKDSKPLMARLQSATDRHHARNKELEAAKERADKLTQELEDAKQAVKDAEALALAAKMELEKLQVEAAPPPAPADVPPTPQCWEEWVQGHAESIKQLRQMGPLPGAPPELDALLKAIAARPAEDPAPADEPAEAKRRKAGDETGVDPNRMSD